MILRSEYVLPGTAQFGLLCLSTGKASVSASTFGKSVLHKQSFAKLAMFVWSGVDSVGRAIVQLRVQNVDGIFSSLF